MLQYDRINRDTFVFKRRSICNYYNLLDRRALPDKPELHFACNPAASLEMSAMIKQTTALCVMKQIISIALLHARKSHYVAMVLEEDARSRSEIPQDNF